MATLYCWTSLKLQKDCLDQIFTDPAVSSKWWIFRSWVNWPFRTNVNQSLSSEGDKMAWRHHFLVLLRLSRCIQVKFEKSERKPKRQRGWRSTAFIPFTTADSFTHFRLNQFSGLRRPKTIISCRQAFPHLQKQDKSGRIVASDSDQSAKVVPRVRPISDDQTPGSNRSFAINCLIRRCTEGHLLVYMLIAAWKLAVMPWEWFLRVLRHRVAQKSWHSPHGCWGKTTLARWRLGKAEQFEFFSVFFCY